jgi:hypothetical protein
MVERLYHDFFGGGVQIVQSDTTTYAEPIALFISAASGFVKITTEDGDILTMNVPYAGWYAPYRVTVVWDTGTTVADADILGLRL